jgi:hypothetical protein
MSANKGKYAGRATRNRYVKPRRKLPSTGSRHDRRKAAALARKGK